ncbi:hypothetical protein OIU85_001396 [Salix viminalis]|uniref:NLE domain-containing protein n=1 Tax=Salix viminalis TaxID=40686 RepID=A0A9Q0ZXS5_SALVM|nr:hypothetical protein OIU85_001396 [Salix viminalis]
MEDETVNNIICQFTDPEGKPLKAPLYIPHNAGPRQIVNRLLNNEEKLPHAFSISDQELVVPLETYSQKSNVSVEKVLPIVYQPQAIFRTRPVNRRSATIAGVIVVMQKLYFQLPLSPDGRQLAIGSGDTTDIRASVLGSSDRKAIRESACGKISND